MEESQKIKTERTEATSNFFSILMSLVTFLPLVLRGSISAVYLILISVVAILIFFFLTYKILTNVITFTILLSLLSVGFPVLHFSIYKINKENYKFEKDFLAKRTVEISEQSFDHINFRDLSNVLSQNDSILNVEIKNLEIDNIYKVGYYTTQVEVINGPEGHKTSYVVLYDSNGVRLGKTGVTKGTMRACLQKEKDFVQQLVNDSKNPIAHIFLNDFWIESITAFSFGNIKANSQLVMIIRAIQYVVAFIFFAMLTNTLRTMDIFVMKRKR